MIPLNVQHVKLYERDQTKTVTIYVQGNELKKHPFDYDYRGCIYAIMTEDGTQQTTQFIIILNGDRVISMRPVYVDGDFKSKWRTETGYEFRHKTFMRIVKDQDMIKELPSLKAIVSILEL